MTIHFSLAAFKTFLSLAFSIFTMMNLFVDPFPLSYLEFLELPGCADCFSIFGRISAMIFLTAKCFNFLTFCFILEHS